MRIHIPQSTALPSPPPYYSKLNIEQMNRYINNCCIIPASPHSSCFSRRKPAGPTTRLDFLASGPLWPGEDTRSSIPSLYVSHQLVRQGLRVELLSRRPDARCARAVRTSCRSNSALSLHKVLLAVTLWPCSSGRRLSCNGLVPLLLAPGLCSRL